MDSRDRRDLQMGRMIACSDAIAEYGHDLVMGRAS
jgi:hypothetical protein